MQMQPSLTAQSLSFLLTDPFLPRLVALGEMAAQLLDKGRTEPPTTTREPSPAPQLNSTQAMIAFHLRRLSARGMAPHILAKLLMCPATRVINQLARMQKAGLVQRIASSEAPGGDGRNRNFYRLSKKGTAAVDRELVRWVEADALLRSLLTGPQYEVLHELHSALEASSLRGELTSVAALAKAAASDPRLAKRRRSQRLALGARLDDHSSLSQSLDAALSSAR